MGLRDWVERSRPAAAVKGERGRDPLGSMRQSLARLTTPLLPDDYLHLVNPLWSARELRGRVVQVRKETADSATLVIKPGWGFTLDYEAGQYIGIGLHVNGRWHWRSYSLTSPPHREQQNISIAVKAMPEGFLSKHLVDGVAAGTIVRLAAPQGNFRLPEPPPATLLFITAGSGITPILSMLRTLARRDAEFPDVVHVHSAPTEADVMFRAELAQYAAAHPSYRLHLQLTDQAGMFDLADLDRLFPDWRGRQAWACGPAAMLDAVEKLYDAGGIGRQLHLERFSIARGGGGVGGTVTFARSGKSAQIDGATTILEAGEQLGVPMPFGCRMGICQTCVAEIANGSAKDLRNGHEHGPGDRVRTCVSTVVGECEVEL